MRSQPAAPRGSTRENKKILQLCVYRFNSRDWDGLRELISAYARLLVADRYSDGFAVVGYLGVYSWMKGEVDAEPLIILLNECNGACEIEGTYGLLFGAEGRVEHVSDYEHSPWILTAGSIVVRGPID